MNFETKITQVTVYPARARIVRTGQAQLNAGEHDVVIGPLPNALREESVRVNGKTLGNGGQLRIQGVEVRTEHVANAPEPMLAELQTQLEALQSNVAIIDDQIAVQKARQEFLSTLRNNAAAAGAKALTKGKADFASVNAVMTQVAGELDDSHARLRESTQQRRELEKQIEIIKAKLAQLQQAGDSTRYKIHILLHAQTETSCELTLTYLVDSAWWQPIYDARVINDKVELTYQAQVSQNSGEDWPATQLLISTAQPALNSDLPELEPSYIDVYRPPARKAMMRSAQMDDAPMLMAMAAPAPEMVSHDMAQVDRSGTAITYRVLRPVAVRADGASHKTTIAVLNLNATLDNFSVPKLAEEVYARAKVTNASDYILLPGQVTIFQGDEFVGNTYIDSIAPNEEFEMQLGANPQISAERELVTRNVGKTLIGNVRRTELAYRIKLHNHMPTPAQLSVHDQLPIARHEDIKVKLQSADPKPNEQSDLNILKWALTLKAGETRQIQFNYTIEHPKDMQIVGQGIEG